MSFDLSGFVARGMLYQLIDESASHLRVALSQALPEDDQIILAHVRSALS